MAATGDVLWTELDLRGGNAYTGGMDRGIASLLRFDRANLRAAAGLAGFGTVAAGAARLATGAITAAADEQTRFERASRNLKGSLPTGELSEFAGGLEKLTGVDAAEIAGAMGLLGTFQIGGADAQRLALPILNAAEALKEQGVSLSQLSLGAGKAIESGSATSLRRTGVILDEVAFKAANTSQRVAMIAEAFNKQGGSNAAEEFRKSLPGARAALDVELGNLQEAFGAALGGGATGMSVLEPVISGVRAVREGIEALGPAAGVLGVALAGGVLVGAAALAKTATQAGKLVLENVKLQNAALGGTEAAKTQAMAITEEGAAAGVAASEYRALAAAKGAAGSVPVGAVPLAAPRVAPPVPSPFAPGAVVPIPPSAKTAGAVAGVLGANLAAGSTAAAEGKAAAAAARAAALGRAGKFVGSPAGMGAMLAGGMALQMMPHEGVAGRVSEVAGGMMTGASLGAMIGTPFGGVGGLVGAGVGAAAGGVSAYLGHAEQPAEERARPEKSESATVTELRRLVDELKAQTGILSDIRSGRGMPVGTSDVAGARQVEAIALAAMHKAYALA